MNVKTIKLSKSIELHEKTITEVQVREPSAAVYLKIGEPEMLRRYLNGTVSVTQDDEKLAAYCKACLVAEDSASLLELMSMTDARKVRQAIRDFFDPPAKAEDNNADATA